MRGIARFPVEEEERLVGAFVDFGNPDRAADVGAELVAVEARRSDALAGDGVVALGELVVAVELPERSVQAVGAALGDHVDLAAGRAAVFRGIGAGLDFELGQGIDGRREAVGHGVVVHDFDAIDVEAVGGVARAVGAGGGGAVGGIGLADGAAPAAHGDGAGSAGLHAGNQLGELDEVAAVERKVDDLGGIDDGTDAGVFGLQEGGGGAHLHRFADVTDFEAQIETGGLFHLQGHILGACHLKAGLGGSHAVGTGRKVGQGVGAGRVGNVLRAGRWWRGWRPVWQRRLRRLPRRRSRCRVRWR